MGANQVYGMDMLRLQHIGSEGSLRAVLLRPKCAAYERSMGSWKLGQSRAAVICIKKGSTPLQGVGNVRGQMRNRIHNEKKNSMGQRIRVSGGIHPIAFRIQFTPPCLQSSSLAVTDQGAMGVVFKGGGSCLVITHWRTIPLKIQAAPDVLPDADKDKDPKRTFESQSILVTQQWNTLGFERESTCRPV
jgi:hypothetical protein